MKLKIRKFCSTSMAISAVGKKIGIKMIRNSGMRFAILNKIVSVDLTEITFAQRTGGRKGARESRKGAEHSRQREQPVQSPWGRGMPGTYVGQARRPECNSCDRRLGCCYCGFL